VAVLPERSETDYDQLPEKEQQQLIELYPGKHEGEGRFGLSHWVWPMVT